MKNVSRVPLQILVIFVMKLWRLCQDAFTARPYLNLSQFSIFSVIMKAFVFIANDTDLIVTEDTG